MPLHHIAENLNLWFRVPFTDAQ